MSPCTANIVCSKAGTILGTTFAGVVSSLTPSGIKIIAPYCSLKWTKSFFAAFSTDSLSNGVNSDMIMN